MTDAHVTQGQRSIAAEIEADLNRLRARQAKRVMRVVGPLLDEWDGIPNDVKGMPELKDFRRSIARLNRVVES